MIVIKYRVVTANIELGAGLMALFQHGDLMTTLRTHIIYGTMLSRWLSRVVVLKLSDAQKQERIATIRKARPPRRLNA